MSRNGERYYMKYLEAYLESRKEIESNAETMTRGDKENGTWLFFSQLPDQQGPAFFDYHSSEWIYLRE